jgi:hypothetical protein
MSRHQGAAGDGPRSAAISRLIDEQPRYIADAAWAAAQDATLGGCRAAIANVIKGLGS